MFSLGYWEEILQSVLWDQYGCVSAGNYGQTGQMATSDIAVSLDKLSSFEMQMLMPEINFSSTTSEIMAVLLTALLHSFSIGKFWIRCSWTAGHFNRHHFLDMWRILKKY